MSLPQQPGFHPWRAALRAYTLPSSLALLLLGFAAGMPSILITMTLPVWLREAGVTREDISFISWIGLVYSIKWIWSPMLDQWRLPFIGHFGRRKSWLVFSQTLLLCALVALALSDPQEHLTLLIGTALTVAIASATQDVAIDAYRLEIASSQQQATLAACYLAGYRIATIAAYGGALFLVQELSSGHGAFDQQAWMTTYLCFAVLVVPFIVVSLTIREPLVEIPIHPVGSRFNFKSQLVSVFIVLFLVISLPAMITALLDQAWPRAALYAIIMAVGLSPWGRRQILPVRELVRRARNPLLRAVKGPEVPHFDFVHQGISIIMLLIIAVTATGMYKAYIAGAWPRGTLYLLILCGCLSAPGRLLMAPVATPVREFVQRYRWQALVVLGLISCYRLADIMVSNMIGVFYIDMGYSKSIIGSITNVFGMVMTLLGAGLGGLLTSRFNIMPILLLGGILCAVTNLQYIVLAQLGPIAPDLITLGIWEFLRMGDAHICMLTAAVALDNLGAGIAISAFMAYLSSLTNLKFSATQYAMLSSMMLLLPRFLAGYSGILIDSLSGYSSVMGDVVHGYSLFFFCTTVLGIPAMMLTLWAWYWQRRMPMEVIEAMGENPDRS